MPANHPSILVYRTAYCPFCVAAEQLLQRKDVPFEQVYLDDHPDRRGFVANILPGHSTVPLIIIGERPIGGFQELSGLDHSGELDILLDGG